MLGVGFDVVLSDCLAAPLKRRLPSTTVLAFAFLALGRVSRGTALTMAENLPRGSLVRQAGVFRRVPAACRMVRLPQMGRQPGKQADVYAWIHAYARRTVIYGWLHSLGSKPGYKPARPRPSRSTKKYCRA